MYSQTGAERSHVDVHQVFASTNLDQLMDQRYYGHGVQYHEVTIPMLDVHQKQVRASLLAR